MLSITLTDDGRPKVQRFPSEIHTAIAHSCLSHTIRSARSRNAQEPDLADEGGPASCLYLVRRRRPQLHFPRRGKFMNSRRSCRFLLVCSIVLCAAVAMAQDPTTIFQLDGNPANDNLTCVYGTPCDYWNLINLTGSSGTGRGHSSLNTFILGTTNTLNFQGGGSKDPNDLSQWAYSSTSTPNKDTLNAGYAAAYNIADFDVIFGADRLSPNGDANIGIWFFQQSVGTSNGKFINTATGLPAHHVNGDVFIVSAFVTGGGSSQIQAYEWDSTCPSGIKNPGPGDCAASNLRVLPTAGIAFAITNSSTVNATWAGYSGGTLVSPLFFEGGLDITKAFGSAAVPCFASFLEETRSSQSPTAVLKDFLLGQFPVCSMTLSKQCGTATIGPDGTTVTFPVNGTVTNTGIGTLYNVQVIDTIGSSNKTINVASSLAAGASASWTDSSTSSATSQTDTASAQACTVSGCTTPTVFSTNPSSVTVTCSVPVQNSLTVSKSCSTTLHVDGNVVDVLVSYGGQVCNTGQSQVTNISLTDYTGTSVSAPGTGVDSGLSVGPGTTQNPTCINYGPHNYTPSSINGTATAGRFFFDDTIVIKTATPALGTLNTISTPSDPRTDGSYGFHAASCPICDVGEC